MNYPTPRLATRAIIVHEDRLLLVNAYQASHGSDLWCAPGGGVTPGLSLPENVAREVHEETGLDVSVGNLALVNEFHDPGTGFHQVDLFFRCRITGGRIDRDWRDPEGVVHERRFFSRTELQAIRLKPDSLTHVAFSTSAMVHYDPLECIVE